MPANPAMGVFEVPGTGTFDRATGQFLGKGTGRTAKVSGMGPPQAGEPRPGDFFTKGSGRFSPWTGPENNGFGQQGGSPATRTSANRVPDYKDAQGNQYDGNSGRMMVPGARPGAPPPPPAPSPFAQAAARSPGYRPGVSGAETRRQSLNEAASQAGAQSIYRDPASARPEPSPALQPGMGVLQSGSTPASEFRGNSGGIDWGQKPSSDSTGGMGFTGSPLKAADGVASQGPTLRADIAQWAEDNKNAPRSVIDGETIVTRYMKKLNQSNVQTAAGGGAAGFQAATQVDPGTLGAKPETIAFNPSAAAPNVPAMNFQQASQADPVALGVSPTTATFDQNPTKSPSRAWGDAVLAENSAVRGGAPAVAATEEDFTTGWINRNLPSGVGSFQNLQSFPSLAASGFSPNQKFYADGGAGQGIAPQRRGPMTILN